MEKPRLAIASNIVYELLFKDNIKFTRSERDALMNSWIIIEQLRKEQRER